MDNLSKVSFLLVVSFLLLQGAVAPIPSVCNMNVLQQCSQASNAAPPPPYAYYYGFRAPRDINDQQPPNHYSLIKFGFSNHDAFLQHRYNTEFKTLISMCLIDGTLGNGAPYITPITNRAAFLQQQQQNNQIDNTILTCVRNYMQFVGAIRCRSTERCMDMRFVCAIQNYQNAQVGQIVARQPVLHQITVAGQRLDVSFLRGKVPWLGSGSTEWFQYNAPLLSVSTALARIFTDAQLLAHPLQCDTVGGHDGINWANPGLANNLVQQYHQQQQLQQQLQQQILQRQQQQQQQLGQTRALPTNDNRNTKRLRGGFVQVDESQVMEAEVDEADHQEAFLETEVADNMLTPEDV